MSRFDYMGRPLVIVPKFFEITEGWGKYVEFSRAVGRDINPDLAAEVSDRFKKIDCIVEMVLKLDLANWDDNERRVLAIKENPSNPVFEFNSETAGRRSMELQILVETFYHFAWRVYTIIRNVTGIKNIDAPGVRDVRNQLIEHPETSSNVFIVSFASGGAHGPIIKGVRYDHQSHVCKDAGMYVNAREFHEAVCKVLLRAMLNEMRMVAYVHKELVDECAEFYGIVEGVLGSES